MKLLRLFFIIFFIILPNQIKAEEGDLKNKITKNLRCLICQGQSVYDSDSEFANSLKIVVNKKLDEGFSEKEIYKYFEDKYPILWRQCSSLIDQNSHWLFLPMCVHS